MLFQLLTVSKRDQLDGHSSFALYVYNNTWRMDVIYVLIVDD